jgi:hypothetical protein
VPRERKTIVRWSIIVAAAAVAAAAGAAPRDRLGADACAQSCHADALASWRKTAHARASSTEVLGRRARDAACLSCHATARDLPGVQCESCHGDGARYAEEDVMRDPFLARRLGLADAKQSCVRCHRADAATTLAPFDYDTAWKKVAH